jgi:formyl-CoA transferase
MILGDLGAEIIKIEARETGDPFRKWGGHKGGARPQFLAYNRGKKSVSLNIQTSGGQSIIKRLARSSDVLLENFRPGTLDRLGLGFDDLRSENERLVYCSITGFGRTGPYARRPSYENVGLALSGLWSRLTDIARPRPIGPNLVDQLTALTAVYGILGALVHVGRHGIGQRVEVNMLASTIAFMPEPMANYLTIGEIGDLDTRARRSQAYALVAGDGRPLAVHLSSVPKFWEGLTRAIGRPELVDDPRFATNADRVSNYDALRDIIETTVRARPRDEWLARLEENDVPAAPINTIPEALDDPQVRHLGLVHQYGHDGRAVALVRTPVDYSATPLEDVGHPPDLGQDTFEVLRRLGYSEDEARAFRDDGTI